MLDKDYEYHLGYTDIWDTPKGLFQSFERGWVRWQDYEDLRDILIACGMNKQAKIVNHRVDELLEYGAQLQ